MENESSFDRFARQIGAMIRANNPLTAESSEFNDAWRKFHERKEPTPEVTIPLAKRRNPEWEQSTVYIRKHTKRAARMKLLDDKRDLSDVIEQLLSDWVKQKS